MQFIDATDDHLIIEHEGQRHTVPWDAIAHTRAPDETENWEELTFTLGTPSGAWKGLGRGLHESVETASRQTPSHAVSSTCGGAGEASAGSKHTQTLSNRTSVTVPLRDDPHVQALFVAAGTHGAQTKRTQASIRESAAQRGHTWHLAPDGSVPEPHRAPPAAPAATADSAPVGFSIPMGGTRKPTLIPLSVDPLHETVPAVHLEPDACDSSAVHGIGFKIGKGSTDPEP